MHYSKKDSVKVDLGQTINKSKPTSQLQCLTKEKA